MTTPKIPKRLRGADQAGGTEMNTIESLRAQLAASQEREARLRVALEFYADRKNWDDRWIEACGDEGRDGDVFDVISQDDVTIEEDEHGPYMTFGGKRARESLSSTPEPRMLTESNESTTRSYYCEMRPLGPCECDDKRHS